jgi:L-aspartate oxidase
LNTQAPIVIVGSGIAGLSTALACAPRPVLLLSRGHRNEACASLLAQGGIAAAVSLHDSHRLHLADTLTAGAHHNDVSAARELTRAAPAAIAWLQGQGVEFDSDGPAFQLGREGGHGIARIVHAGGDATGAHVTRALAARVERAPHVTWRGNVDVDALLLGDGRIHGVHMGDAREGGDVAASDVVLATGGIGALFAHTTNPPGADGAGLALALAAGAQARDLEFIQFHPTALDVQGMLSHPLITEALRGAGARLLGVDGHALMAGVHPLGDLAPRDVVARRIWQVQREGGSVVLDARNAAIDWPTAFPSVLAACLAHGIDPRLQAIPVTPAAHFHMGGVACDRIGRTSISGLHVVGELACSGVHGANRLASNSLLEGVVCGRRLGAWLAQKTARIPSDGVPEIVALGPGLSADAMVELRALLWRVMGPVRYGDLITGARPMLDALADAGWQGRLARRLVDAASQRRNSLGAHWREDASPVDNIGCAA